MRYSIISLCICSIFFSTYFMHVHAQEQPQSQESTETQEGPVLTDKPLEIWTFIDDYRLITGKVLHVTIQAIWKLGVSVNLDGIDKINLHPFRIEGVTIGERQIFDNEHDYIVITYALSLPPDIKDGIYSIPSFSLSYRNEIDKTEGSAISSPITIKKVPIFVEGKVDKDVITLGDHINYTLTIRHEKRVNLLWENIEKLNFSPFEVLKKDIVRQREGDIEKISINYILSLYDLGGKKKTPEIPEQTITYYYGQSQNKNNNKKTENTSFETQEVKTTPVPIIINSLLKAVDVPLEGIKGPFYYSKRYILTHGYLPIGLGIVLFLSFCVMFIRSATRKFSPVTPKPIHETPQIALERLKNTMAQFQFTNEDTTDRSHVYNIDKAFRTYLGTLIGLSTEMAQSMTTSDFLSNGMKKQLPEEIYTTAQAVLKQLDALVFGRHIDKETVNKMIQGIEEITVQTNLKL